MLDRDMSDNCDMSVGSEHEEQEGVPPLPVDREGLEDYFTSYEDVEIHRLMVSDIPRTQAYADAISKNKHLFQGKTVMDVGAGTGILSLFMAAAGARRVYAVEASGMAAVIQKVAQSNGFGEVIQVLHSRVEDVSLPEGEKVDVMVSEWMGFYLLHESMLNSVIWARDHFLDDDGVVFPSEARIYASPCSLQSLYREQITYWDKVFGFDMSAVKEYALRSKMIKPEVCLVAASDLLAEPTCLKKFNLRWVTEDEVKQFSEVNFVGITNTGSYQGLCLWFECDFDGRDYTQEGEEYGSLVTLSTSPLSPATHWKQTVVVLGYGVGAATPQVELLCQENMQGRGDNLDTHSSAHTSTDARESRMEEATSSTTDTTSQPRGNDESNSAIVNNTIQLDYDNVVEKDEVVGWRLSMVQSEGNVRHYTMTVEMLDPEAEEHPIPCCCPTPRCLIIAKMLELEEAQLEQEEVLEEDDDTRNSVEIES